MNDSRQAWQTFWLAAATILMVSLDATVVVAAFPALRAHFVEASAATLSWTINGYTIVFAALLVPAGRWVDRLGHRLCFLAAVVGFTLASAACAFATAPVWLIAARVLQAVSAALLSPASLALILAAFPKEHRSRSAGLWSAVGALAAALGPLIGSLLIEWFSWRMIFLINVPIGFGVWWLGRRRLKESKVNENRYDFDALGTLLIIVGVGCFAGGLAQAEQFEWTSRNVTWPLAAGITLVMSFVVHARGRRDAALDLALFDQSNYGWASAATLVLGMAFGMMFLSFYLFFTGVWHFQQSVAGMAATPGPLLATALAIVVSKKQDQWGKKRLLSIGGVLFALSNVWLSLRISAAPAYLGTWLPGQIIGGIAIGLMLPSLAGAAMAELQSHNLGVGSAVNNAIRQLGSALGVALAIALAGNASNDVEPFRLVYLCLASAGLMIALLAQALSREIKAKTQSWLLDS
jgi:EmrB/QacA subfamily drug resistance transporter